jgi:epoxide hydrolase-like predicted phosphatase
MISITSYDLKKYSWLLMDFTILIGMFLFITAHKNQKVKTVDFQEPINQVSEVQETTVKTVIFDLGGVFFKTSKKTKLSFLPLILKNPSLLKIDLEQEFYAILDTIPAASKDTIYNKGQKLPLIMSDWMSGIKTPQEIKQLVDTAIKNNSNYSNVQKKLFNKMSDLMFIPEKLAHSQKLIKSMISIVKKLKEAGYKVYILSNWDEQSFTHVYHKNTKLFELFDKICISGKEKLSKPNPKFFEKLLQSYNLNPAECIFIDDESHNIATAEKLGFQVIQHTNKPKTHKELIKLGISIKP